MEIWSVWTSQNLLAVKGYKIVWIRPICCQPLDIFSPFMQFLFFLCTMQGFNNGLPKSHLNQRHRSFAINRSCISLIFSKALVGNLRQYRWQKLNLIVLPWLPSSCASSFLHQSEVPTLVSNFILCFCFSWLMWMTTQTCNSSNTSILIHTCLTVELVHYIETSLIIHLPSSLPYCGSVL